MGAAALGLLGGAFPGALGCGPQSPRQRFLEALGCSPQPPGQPFPGALGCSPRPPGWRFPRGLWAAACGLRPPGQQVPCSSPQPGSGAASTRQPPVGGRERVLSGRASGAFRPAVVARSPTWPPSPGEKRRKEESANRHPEVLCRMPAPGPWRGPCLSRGASLEDQVLHSTPPSFCSRVPSLVLPGPGWG